MNLSKIHPFQYAAFLCGVMFLADHNGFFEAYPLYVKKTVNFTILAILVITAANGLYEKFQEGYTGDEA